MTVSSSIRRIGFWGAVAILALRLGVGWHFFKEGAKKFHGDGFTSVYFLNAATGPLADLHKSRIPDRFGHKRLSYDETSAFWTRYKENVEKRLRFNDAQSKQADTILKRYKLRMKKYLADDRDEIKEYFLEVDRFRDDLRDDTRSVAFQRDRIAKKEVELRGQVSPWLAGVRTLSQQLEKDLNGIADGSSDAKRISIPDRSKPWVDEVVKYWVIGVGILMMLGLFTRLAALGGIGFLLAVMSTQPPWAYGAVTDYFYYQLVEVLAFVVLAVFAAGQFAGLDYVIYGMYGRCCPPKNNS